MMCFNSLEDFFLWRQNIKKFIKNLLRMPEGFWSDVANDIFWYKKPTKILNSDNPPFYKWFQRWNYKHLL